MKEIDLKDFLSLISNNSLEGAVQFEGEIRVHKETGIPAIESIILSHRGRSSLSKDKERYSLEMDNVSFEFNIRRDETIQGYININSENSIAVPIDLTKHAILYIISIKNIVY